ncbi:hypothetical protein [Antrihabitans spumae]|uniref:Uncharacterized protein n=1 Tax=Antrihabitans spumae TaxID=3373370 RepID=A0ABW7KCY4_9NOCA
MLVASPPPRLVVQAVALLLSAWAAAVLRLVKPVMVPPVLSEGASIELAAVP